MYGRRKRTLAKTSYLMNYVLLIVPMIRAQNLMRNLWICNDANFISTEEKRTLAVTNYVMNYVRYDTSLNSQEGALIDNLDD